MHILFKSILIFMGGILLGFGMGIVATNFLIKEEAVYWGSIVGTLILGGFFIALGMTAKTNSFKEEVSGPEKIDNYSNKVETNYSPDQEGNSRK